MLALICVLLALIYLLLNVCLVAVKNYKAHKFFKTKTPQLPTVPNPNIFSGHIFDITYPNKNWSIIADLHKKYGKTFGFYSADQPWVSTTDIDLIKKIEIDEARKHVNRVDYAMPFEDFTNSIWQVKDEEWRQARRTIAPALTNRKVHSSEISSEVELVVEELRQALEAKLAKAEMQPDGSRSCEMVADDMFLRFTLAIIFRITYKRDNLIDFHGESDYWTSLIDSGIRDFRNPLLPMTKIFRFLEPMTKFLVKYHRIGRFNDKLIEFIVNAMEINKRHRKRLEDQKERKHYAQLSLKKNSKGDDSGLDDESTSGGSSSGSEAGDGNCSDESGSSIFKHRLVDNIIDAFLDRKMLYKHFVGTTQFFLLAGFQTTAESITHLTWQLAKHPEVQEKLRQAIRAEGLECDYLHWCTYEGLRLHPSVPLGTGRVLGDDVIYNGLTIPKGTFVMPSTHTIHHDSTIWPEADRFDPERWRNSRDFHPAAFQAFGLGPRNCVGLKLAIHEIKLVIQMLVSNYRIVKYADTVDKYHFSTPGLIYTLVDQPIKVRLEPLNAH